MYGYRCEYCEGTVQPRIVKREAFKHRDGFVILEDVTIGVCDPCGNRYYSADILHAVHAVATEVKAPKRTEQIWHLQTAVIPLKGRTTLHHCLALQQRFAAPIEFLGILCPGALPPIAETTRLQQQIVE